MILQNYEKYNRFQILNNKLLLHTHQLHGIGNNLPTPVIQNHLGLSDREIKFSQGNPPDRNNIRSTITFSSIKLLQTL